MNLIEQLGGYEKAKEKAKEIDFDLNNLDFSGGGSPMESMYERLESIGNALLEYRREHHIYESLDKVVLVGSGTTNVLLEIIDYKYTSDLYRVRVLSTGSMGPLHRGDMRHATPAEIEAGKD